MNECRLASWTDDVACSGCHQPDYNPRCTSTTSGAVCGCMWSQPKPPKALMPLSPRELLIAKVRDAIFDELDRQHESSEIDWAGF